METKRKIVIKKLNTFDDVNDYFQKLSGIDMENIPEKYGTNVETAKKLLEDNLEAAIVYKCDDIEGIGDQEVILAGGEKYKGKMAPKILAESKQVISFLITLRGYTELVEAQDDVMVQYFVDTWGSAYVEAAQGWLGRKMLEELRSEGYSRTHLWSPGQHQFELMNQKPLFVLLAPEEVGCTLTKRCMMVPLKSASGIMGVVEEGTKNLLLPCDFCPRGADCPASKRGCAEL